MKVGLSIEDGGREEKRGGQKKCEVELLDDYVFCD